VFVRQATRSEMAVISRLPLLEKPILWLVTGRFNEAQNGELDLIDAVCLFAPDTVRFENFFCRRAGEVSFGSLVVRGGPDCGHGLRRAVRTVGAQISEP
jgi:hypothetical protein